MFYPLFCAGGDRVCIQRGMGRAGRFSSKVLPFALLIKIDRLSFPIQLVGKSESCLVVLDLASEQPAVAKVRFKIKTVSSQAWPSPWYQVLDGVPEGWCPALAVWWSGGVAGVAYRFLLFDIGFKSIGFRSTPRRLGKVYCSNRPGAVFFLKDGVWVELAGGDR